VISQGPHCGMIQAVQGTAVRLFAVPLP
jgi:hypothetical protein